MMRPFLKTILVVGLLVIFSACGPLTPIPSATPTSTVVLTPTETKAPLVLSLVSSDGPDMGVDSYQLREWDEQDYKKLIGSLGDMIGDKDGQIPYGMAPDYRMAFQSERLLKFPDSPAREDVIWEMLSENPNIASIPGIEPSNDRISEIIADMLEQGITPDELGREFEKHEWNVTETMEVNNIVGNGEKGQILIIRIPNNSGLTGIFAVFRQDDQFKVEKIHDWDISQAPALGRYFALKDVGDMNGNGLPEIVVEIETGGSGMPQIGKKEIEHIEWSNQKNKFNHQSFPVYWQTCDELGTGPCVGDVEFSKKDSLPVLTTRSYWYTRNDCPTFAIQRNAEWDGEKYAPGQPEIVPPVSDLTPECRLAWAETAIELRTNDWDGDIKESGWKNHLAISIVEKSLQSWTDLADEWWGPAGRDFFKLRLGIWYELRGQDDKAKSTLQSLAAKPHLTDFDFASRLAKIYIEERAVSGPARACLSLNDAYFAEYRQAVPDLSFNDDVTLVEQWGFVSRKGLLCSVTGMLPADVQIAHLTSTDALESWLQKTGFTLYQDEVLDLNSDGIEDHLILLDTTDSETPDAWAFIGTVDGYKAAFIFEPWFESEQPEMAIKALEMGETSPAYVIFSDDLTIFRLTPDFAIETLLQEYSVKSYQIIDETMPPKIVLEIDGTYEGHRFIPYEWNTESQVFIEAPDEFVLAENEITKLLYEKQDYQGVISYINAFLQKDYPEPKRVAFCGMDIPDGCVYQPEWYIPYFGYLRGVAYEQMNQIEPAKQAYYKLWQDYPKNIFGMAAMLKLEPSP